jgi:hypothetical protein
VDARRAGPPDDGRRDAARERHRDRARPRGGRVARSRDLAYTYGRIVAPAGPSYYVHLWTRDAAGAWRIAIALRP